MKTQELSEASKVVWTEANKADWRLFAKTHDQFEDLQRKHKLAWRKVATAEQIGKLEIPEADKAELLRLDSLLGEISARLPPD